MISAGKLRHKIDIQNFTVAASSYGEPVKTWNNFLSSRWAAIDFKSGDESFGGEGMPERITAQQAIFTIRYSTGLDETMRIVHDGKNWNILDITDPNFMHIELQIRAILVE